MSARDGDESRTVPEFAPMDRVPAGELTRGFVLAGRYEVQAVIGRGGMGVVVRAFDRVIGEEVAIKVLRPEYAQDHRWTERLAREVRLARTIQHPNVCRIFDFGEADGHSFITMELATGGTLRDAIAGAPDRPVEDRVADATAVIEGLAAIHAAGIVHRDVTPQNILRMGDGRLVVSDFGLASIATGTTTSIHGGTIAYMAPEVLRGAAADFASDVWGLGLIVWEVLTGVRPNLGGERLPTFVRRKSGSEVEQRLMRICHSCLVVNPVRRPGTAGDVLAMLEQRRRLPGRFSGRAIIWVAAVVAAIVVAVVGVTAARRTAMTGAGATPAPPAIQRDDGWLSKSRTLTTYDSRIECIMALPDKKTIRVVLEEPRRAEDVDIETGKSRPANLAPIAIAEGCARLSPDGKRLVYQGRDDKQRPHAMLSPNPDGTQATPVVRSAEPSYASEPHWLDNDTFVFDIDYEHAAAFSVSTGKVVVIPGAPDELAHRTGFSKTVGDGKILVAHSDDAGTRQNVRIFQWPDLRVVSRFHVDGFVLHWTLDGGNVLATSYLNGIRNGIVRVNRTTGVAIRSEIPDRIVGATVRIDATRLSLVAWSPAPEVWVRDSARQERRVFVDGEPQIVDGSSKGEVLVATLVDDRSVIMHYGADGKLVDRLTNGPNDVAPMFFPDGNHWLFVKMSNPQGIYKCSFSDKSCKRVAEHDPREAAPTTWQVAISPNGQRLAFLVLASSGVHVSWMAIDGAATRPVAESETGCTPIWASDTEIWISRRLDGKPVWVEYNADSASETGRRHAGLRECITGGTDPAAPIEPRAWIKHLRRSDLRIVNMPVN